LSRVTLGLGMETVQHVEQLTIHLGGLTDWSFTRLLSTETPAPTPLQRSKSGSVTRRPSFFTLREYPAQSGLFAHLSVSFRFLNAV
jgi:hypothetical protein